MEDEENLVLVAATTTKLIFKIGDAVVPAGLRPHKYHVRVPESDGFSVSGNAIGRRGRERVEFSWELMSDEAITWWQSAAPLNSRHEIVFPYLLGGEIEVDGEVVPHHVRWNVVSSGVRLMDGSGSLFGGRRMFHGEASVYLWKDAFL